MIISGMTDSLDMIISGMTDSLDMIISGMTDWLDMIISGMTDSLDMIISAMTDSLDMIISGCTTINAVNRVTLQNKMNGWSFCLRLLDHIFLKKSRANAHISRILRKYIKGNALFINASNHGKYPSVLYA